MQQFKWNLLKLKECYIRIKICAWHWLLLTLETTLISLQRRFNQTTSAFIFFFSKKPTEWRFSNGSQYCACYASKKHNKRPLRVTTQGICKYPGCQCVCFPRCCLSANTRPRERVSRENYEPCPQLPHGWRTLHFCVTFHFERSKHSPDLVLCPSRACKLHLNNTFQHL